jgi:hypothetical protein
MNAAPDQPSFVPARRFTTALSVAVSVVAALGITIALNYLAVTRQVWRRDFSDSGARPLSPLTLQTLAGLTNDVKVTVLFRSDSALFPHVDRLLREYATRQPRVGVQYIDYLRSPGAAELAKVRYKLGTAASDLVVFESGGRQFVVNAADLTIYNDQDLKALMGGQPVEIRRAGFRGEERFTAAVASVSEGVVFRAAYLQGHGEHPGDSDEAIMGYANFNRLLVSERNLQIQPLKLAGTTNELPADCQLLIIAGPTAPFLIQELAQIEAFLQRGGRLLVLLHPHAVARQTGLENLLAKWAIVCPPMYAGDEQLTSYTKLDVISKSFGAHALMAPLRREEGALYFPLPRVVAPMPPDRLPADAPKADVLVLTSAQGLTKSRVSEGDAAFDPIRDQRNLSVPLAVAAEKGGVAGVATGRGATRLVVIGDSTMFGNKTLDDANNRDFAGLCVSWLLDRPQALAIGPKPINEYRLNLTEKQLRMLRWTLIGALPGGVLTLGWLVWLRRRS